jgi:opacity protein-like surface antigen
MRLRSKLVSLVLAIAFAAAFAPQASAAPSAGPQPDLPPIYCIGMTHNARTTGTNTWSQYGNVTNNCGKSIYSGNIGLSAAVSCPGMIQNAYPSDSIYLPNPWLSGYGYGYTAGGVARCEVCVNHTPTSFPPMSLTLYADVAGDSGYPNYQEYLGVGPQRSLTLANSPSYAFPCP